jgi:GH25 family lysozyme M1 (1,4-beta-N-acetylmuramidase)
MPLTLTGGLRYPISVLVMAGALTTAAVAANAATPPRPSPASGIIRSAADAGTAATPMEPAAAPPGYPVIGIDVSHYQGAINWGAVAQGGARFSYAKDTEGLSYVDPYFGTNNSGAKSNGLYAGAYSFGRPDKGNPTAQADFLLSSSGYTDDGKTLPPMLDIEWPPSSSGLSACYNLTPVAMVAWIRGFVDQIKARTGRDATIYTNSNWWDSCTGDNSSFSANPLFIASYTALPPGLPAGWATWTLWQYADRGSLPGDQDVFNGSISALATLAKPHHS